MSEGEDIKGKGVIDQTPTPEKGPASPEPGDGPPKNGVHNPAAQPGTQQDEGAPGPKPKDGPSKNGHGDPKTETPPPDIGQVKDGPSDSILDIPNGDGKPSESKAEKRESTLSLGAARPERDYVDPSPVPFWDPSELKRWSLWRAGIAELIASFLFLYIGVQTIIGSAADGTCGGVGTLGIAFAFGVTIFVLVYCIAGLSGGHINPAVTFAMLLVRRVSLARALIYMIAHVLGALAGVGLVKAYQKGYYQRYGGGANYVHNGYPKGAGLVAELVGTFLLVYVVFTATDAKRKTRDYHIPVLAPLTIGLAVFIIHLATIPITGTGINPARSFAAAALWDHHDHAWHDHWIFWVGPMLGATLAAMYYQYVIRAIPFRNVDWANLRANLSRPNV